jgi:hypothetical protein
VGDGDPTGDSGDWNAGYANVTVVWVRRKAANSEKTIRTRRG